MQALRTPEARFADLSGYPFAPHYIDVPARDGGVLRMHYLDEGAPQGEAILCLHGQPTWSYLYRKMIPLLTDAGHRVVAPDFIGFGKSDKPVLRSAYTYANHVAWLKALLEQLDLADITLVCQDWGGLIGLRAAAESPQRFARIVTSNTALPDAQGLDGEAAEQVNDAMSAHYAAIPAHGSVPEMAMAMTGDKSGMGFLHWVKFCAESPGFSPNAVVNLSCGGTLTEGEVAAYAAPFPDEDHMAGARQFPSLVPLRPDNPAIPANRAAWEVFRAWDKPFLTAFGDSDLVTAGQHERFQRDIPGAQGQRHVTLAGVGHFSQEQAPGPLCDAVLKFMAANPL